MPIKRSDRPPEKASDTPSDIPRRDRFGRFNPKGKYYATKAGILRKLPAFRKPAPKPKGYRPQPPAPPRGEAPATAEDVSKHEPPPPPRTVASGRSAAKISTWFRAAGAMAEIRDFHTVKSGDVLFDEDVENFEEGYAVPAIFYSNQGHLLGQVKFNGEVPLLDLIQLLNDKLQFLGEEAPEFDFRKAYTRWEYKYQIVETIGPTSTVLHEKRDSR